ncbi:hypothetical protein F5Y17DRAFT_239897 [Xylariaceae sp. FL0594]|nr:hypothetical protein F5Y17DRAFT_239897 [Xylariaceae sp. FL0594]
MDAVQLQKIVIGTQIDTAQQIPILLVHTRFTWGLYSTPTHTAVPNVIPLSTGHKLVAPCISVPLYSIFSQLEPQYHYTRVRITCKYAIHNTTNETKYMGLVRKHNVIGHWRKYSSTNAKVWGNWLRMKNCNLTFRSHDQHEAVPTTQYFHFDMQHDSHATSQWNLKLRNTTARIAYETHPTSIQGSISSETNVTLGALFGPSKPCAFVGALHLSSASRERKAEL